MWRLETARGVGILSYSKEPANNMDLAFFHALDGCLDSICADRSIRAVVIKSERAGVFLSGADIQIFRENKTAYFVSKASQVFERLTAFEKPVIAAVEGACLGGGCEFALCCDIRIAGENAVFGQPEILYGLIPGGGGIQRLGRIVGRGKALKMLWTGFTYHAAEAYQYGIVDELTKPGAAFQTAMKIAGRIAVNAPAAVRTMKALLNRGLELPMKEAWALDRDAFMALSEQPEAKEGLLAAMEKRLPRYECFTNT